MKSLKTILGIALSVGGLGTAATVTGVSIAQADRAVVDSVVEAAGTTRLFLDISNFTNWSNDSAEMRVHTWNSANGDQCFPCTKINDNYWYADVDLATYASGGGYRFQRCDPNSEVEAGNYHNRGEWCSYSSTPSTCYRPSDWTTGTWSSDVLVSTTLFVTFGSDVPEHVDIFIPGSFNSWSTDVSVSKMTRTSNTVFTYQLNNIFTDSYTYKIVACYSNVSSMNWDHDISGSNENVSIGSSDAGKTKSLGSKTYNFTSNFPVYNPTLTVTFTSAVPDYADIYLPGSFNSWSTDVSVSKMTRTSNTVFTYSLSNVIPGSYDYKVVACYSGASVVDFNHEVDANDQTISISASGNVSLGNRTYDFASKMPQTTVADGAVVTITFNVAIPNTVDIVYVGGLTNWCNTAEDIQAGIMTPSANRKVFTWTIPSGTFTGSYKYKVVAISAYTKVTKIYYDHVVYSDNGSDATLVVDTTTLNYPITGQDIDLVELAAYSFSEGFLFAMEEPCADPNANNSSAVSAIWGTWKSTFEAMPSDSKTLFGTSSGDVITRARTLYLHCVARYGLATWTGAPQASSNSPLNLINNNSSNAIVYISVIAVLVLSAAGAFFILRKKKHD